MMETETPAPLARPVRVPVDPLPYSTDIDEPVARVAMRYVVVLAAVVAALGVVLSVYAVWIELNPKAFTGVGSSWPSNSSLSKLGLAADLCSGVANLCILGGSAAFFRGWRGARPLLLWGAAGAVASRGVTFVMAITVFPVLNTAGYDIKSAVVLMALRVNWSVAPLEGPALLLLLMTRREVKRWMAGQ